MTTSAERSPAPDEAQRQVAVVVLGAGRSGTSAITRGIQALGVDLGDKLRPPGGKNPTGFFEDQDLLALNKRLKRILGIRGHSLRLIREEEWQAPEVQALRREAVSLVGTRFGQSPVWGFKYARTLRMLPFWESVFDELQMDVRYVLALRNPLSVARSRSQLNPERGQQAWSDLEWLVNVVPYFDRLRGHALAAIDFDQMLAEPEAQLVRVGNLLQLPLGQAEKQAIDTYAQSFLRTGMRHSQFTLDDLDTDARVNNLVRQAYAWLHRLAYDEVAADDAALWQDWDRIKQGLDELAPLFIEFDRLRNQLNRARWNPASPFQAISQLWRDYRSR